jgi:hypothetical protein
VSPEAVGTSVQNVCVAFAHVYDIVVNVEIIPIVRKPDVDKSYSRVKLIGQIKILRLTELEEAVDAASIMRSRNAQCCHSSMIGSVAHPRSVRDEIVHRSLRCSASGYVIGDPTGRTATDSATLSAAASLPVPCSARTSGRPGTSVTTGLAFAFGAARPVLDAAESAAVPRTSGRLQG